MSDIAYKLISIPANTNVTGFIGLCVKCDWPVLSILGNDGFGKTIDDSSSDWYAMCVNKTCEHHKGEGYFQSTPRWVIE